MRDMLENRTKVAYKAPLWLPATYLFDVTPFRQCLSSYGNPMVVCHLSKEEVREYYNVHLHGLIAYALEETLGLRSVSGMECFQDSIENTPPVKVRDALNALAFKTFKELPGDCAPEVDTYIDGDVLAVYVYLKNPNEEQNKEG